MGLAYGWLIDPVDFFDLTPDTLRADYKTDYVLMTAEAYRVEQDPGLAARRLAIFGSQSPSAIAAQGLEYARTNGFHTIAAPISPELERLERDIEERRWWRRGSFYQRSLAEEPIEE